MTHPASPDNVARSLKVLSVPDSGRTNAGKYAVMNASRFRQTIAGITAHAIMDPWQRNAIMVPFSGIECDPVPGLRQLLGQRRHPHVTRRVTLHCPAQLRAPQSLTEQHVRQGKPPARRPVPAVITDLNSQT